MSEERSPEVQSDFTTNEVPVLNVNDAGVARLMRQQLVTRLRVQ